MQMVMLLDVKENINICAQILKKYLSEQDIKINFYERMLKLVRLYVTGKLNCKIYPWIYLHHKLLLYSI